MGWVLRNFKSIDKLTTNSYYEWNTKEYSNLMKEVSYNISQIYETNNRNGEDIYNSYAKKVQNIGIEVVGKKDIAIAKLKDDIWHMDSYNNLKRNTINEITNKFKYLLIPYEVKKMVANGKMNTSLII